MRHSFFSMACLAAASVLVACGRSNLDDFVFSANPSGGSGGEGATGGTGGIGGIGGNGGGIGGTGNVGATGGTGGIGGFCGDGIVAPFEECDDGNTSVNDSCLDCRFAQCGDGAVWFDVEQCDDGNFDTTDECPKCQKAFCGDGFVWPLFEQCDDGNTNEGDGCTTKCTVTFPGCGNGIIEPGEQCDDANPNPNDSCISCFNAKCGDGFVWTGVEKCDDGNVIDGDGCSSMCTPSLQTCGNGIIEPGEQCDDANPNPNDACIGCVKAKCGDGFVWTGFEKCDDGNTVDGDGCSSKCTLPVCGDGIVDPGELCDDGNTNVNDACVNCAKAKCGDGFVWTGFEQCDDGNVNNGDGCSSVCLLPKCGDGTVDTGEECDDGNQTNGDGCSSSCKLSSCGDGFVDPSEACDLGSSNADRPALLVKQGTKQFAVRPIDRGANVVTFYAYGSGSSHTGYEVLQGSRIYFYRDTNNGSLNLVFHHGIDFNSSGQSQPSAQVNWTVAGLPSSVLVAVADDSPGELSKSSPTTVLGKWNMQNNSDGGAIGVFPFPGNFTTTIAPTFSAGINNWAWINGDDIQTSLNLTQTVEITAFSTPSACRLNCSIPACGDGILDGGEVCDDGNTTGGDGCAANCTSLN